MEEYLYAPSTSLTLQALGHSEIEQFQAKKAHIGHSKGQTADSQLTVYETIKEAEKSIINYEGNEKGVNFLHGPQMPLFFPTSPTKCGFLPSQKCVKNTSTGAT